MEIVVITYISTQHRYFTVFLPKRYCYGSIAHREIDLYPWHCGTHQKSVCQLHVADTLNLTQRDYSSTFIVGMPPRRRQEFSSDVMWQIIGLRGSGLK